MDNPNFDFEFFSEIEAETDEARAECLNRLEALAKGHRDMVGASVAVEELSNEETPHRYQVRIVAYTKPATIAATEKESTLPRAIKGALDAIERQVREQRENSAKPWQPS